MNYNQAKDDISATGRTDAEGVPYGFFTCVLCREDLAQRLPEKTMERLDGMDMGGLLSVLADQMQEEFEETMFDMCLRRVLDDAGLTDAEDGHEDA